MRTALLAAALVAAAVAAGAALAQDRGGKAMESKPIEVGAAAPDFRLNDHEGKAVRLSDFRGKAWVVLAFYPKAMTGG